jgi:hypothetical protein
VTSKKRAPLPRGPEPVVKARALLGQRVLATRPPLTDLAHSSDAARFWSERAWSELGAVPAMSQTALALLRNHGDVDSLGALMQIGADEVRHTEMARDVADALGGYVETIPAGAAWQPVRLGDPSDMPLEFWLVANGCISETISLALMKARLPYATHAGVRAVLDVTVKDEAVHAKIGWSLAERFLPGASRAMKRQLADYAGAMFDVIGVTFATAGLRGKARVQARRMREVTSSLGLGACPPDEADAVCKDTITDVIVPRLRALGLPL